MAHEAQQQVDEQPRPDLPPDRVLVVPHEVVDQAGLLEFLEKQLDGPPGLVEFRDGPCAPVEIVRQEDHLRRLAVHLDACGHAAQGDGVELLCVGEDGLDEFVADDARVRAFPETLHAREAHVLLLPDHEEDAAHPQSVEKAEIRIGPVGDAHVPGLQAGAERLRAHGVVVRRVLHDGEGGQAAAGVEPQVQLGGRLLPAVPRPVDAVQAQLDGAGIDGEDPALQAGQEAFVPPVLPEAGADAGQVVEDLPVEPLGHVRVPAPVRVGERVALRRLRAADVTPLALVDAGRVHDPVEAVAARDLPVHQRDHVAHRGPFADVELVLVRQPLDHPGWNPLDELPQHGVHCLRRLRGRAPEQLGYQFFHAPVGYRRTSPKPTYFFRNCGPKLRA